MTKVPANTLKVGDVIMPPAREVSLWMRRHTQKKGMSESALHLTVTDVREGSVDKGGLWLVVSTHHSAEWCQGRDPQSFNFWVRPTSLWLKVA